MYRSLLYVPAHAERFIAKAHTRGADAIILDLEDAVPEPDKDRAREGLRESVAQVGQAGAAVLVRINAGAQRGVRTIGRRDRLGDTCRRGCREQ